MSLRIGIFGGGTVGGGVVQLLKDHKKRFEALNVTVEIVKIVVRDANKPRDFPTDKITISTNFDDILKDDSINCIIEVMGGVTSAKDVVFEALKSKKHVVTANKALVAAYCDELTSLAKENGCFLGFEAAVCGGIPIIDLLQSAYIGDSITKVSGIFNGTTNFMLSKMENGAEYVTVLKEAQDLGFAEADPSADVDGYDVQAKIALCTKLAFGSTVPLDGISTRGIRRVTKIDFEYAKLLNCTIKLLGVSQLSDGKLSVYVSPCLVPADGPFGCTGGCTNLAVIESKNLGTGAYSGPGAGRFPTANSIVSDILRAAKPGAGETVPFPISNKLEMEKDIHANRFYVRIKVTDGLGIIKSIGTAAEASGASIDSILQNPIVDKKSVDFVVVLENCTQSQVDAFCAEVGAYKFVLEEPFSMPLM